MGVLLFLSSGLFLGWPPGANDAANVFGTAVGTRMVRFRTAALVCSVFIVLGAVVSGAGAARTPGRLGAASPEWLPLPSSTVNRIYNKELERKLSCLEHVFRRDARAEPAVGYEAAAGTAGSADVTPE